MSSDRFRTCIRPEPLPIRSRDGELGQPIALHHQAPIGVIKVKAESSRQRLQTAF